MILGGFYFILKKKLISNYQIFFDLRDKYPEHCQLLSTIMKFYFDNKESFKETTYLDGIFNENDVRFIFESLNLPLTISKIIPTTLRSKSYTIVELIF